VSARAFHLGDLVSVVTGRLVSPNHIGGVYDVCDYVTGQAHMTHQLPRACNTVKPWLYAQHPWLAEIDVPEWVCDEVTVSRWLAEATAQHGELHVVEPMPIGMYVGREPIAELQEMASHAQIIAIVVPPGDAP
jgi:hypothetical protein